MSHSKTRLWVHIVFSVKKKQNLILPAAEPKIHQMVKEQFIGCGCYVAALNGVMNHLHVLIDLNRNRSLSSVMKQVKGATSRQIRKEELVGSYFRWQVGYGGFSVSHSMVGAVCTYIANQKIHHSKQTLESEYLEFLELYGLDTEGADMESEEEEED